MPHQCERKLRHYAAEAGEKNKPALRQTMAGAALPQNNALIQAQILLCMCTEITQEIFSL